VHWSPISLLHAATTWKKWSARSKVPAVTTWCAPTAAPCRSQSPTTRPAPRRPMQPRQTGWRPDVDPSPQVSMGEVVLRL